MHIQRVNAQLVLIQILQRQYRINAVSLKMTIFISLLHLLSPIKRHILVTLVLVLIHLNASRMEFVMHLQQILANNVYALVQHIIVLRQCHVVSDFFSRPLTFI